MNTLRSIGLAVVACLGLLLATPAFSQNISQTDSDGNVGADFTGQSFTATVTGTVTQIQIGNWGNGPTTLRLYNGTGTGQAGGVGAPVSSQSVTLNGTAGELQTITLAAQLPIVAGNVYSFAFDNATLATVTGANKYPQGTYFYDGTNTSLPYDTRFVVTQVAAAPVPTLSEWAMILFGILLAGGAALYVQRRRLMA